MTTDLQPKLDHILALCQQVRETRAKMTPGPWEPPSLVVVQSSDKVRERHREPNATGIALEHNVSLALVETTEIAIKAIQTSENLIYNVQNDYDDDPPQWWRESRTEIVTALQSIADIWQKLGLI